jgi:hypothetical protein
MDFNSTIYFDKVTCTHNHSARLDRVLLLGESEFGAIPAAGGLGREPESWLVMGVVWVFESVFGDEFLWFCFCFGLF